ncbi:MAG: Gfo/Idh/MocA family oxidoreductase [Pirellulales bacterium]|nr:Gfo/Idh/MocA family oxidoreductase [Pirellulales bacterium]
MHLTPEQQAIGKENFRAAIGNKLVNRDFLQKGTEQGLASGKGLGAYYFGYEKPIDKKVRVAVLGTGDEGSVLIGALNPDFFDVVAIADVRPYNVYRAFHGDYYSPTAIKLRPGLMKLFGWETEEEAREHVKVYGPYEKLIEDEKDNLDGVIIALPLHLHAPAAIAAMKAGLHVLTEKLMGHSVHECKEMARVALDKKVLLATGHQRHYSILYHNAVDLIEKGVLGDLHYIRAQWHRNNLPGSDSWQNPMPEKAKPKDKQAKRLGKDLESWEKRLAVLAAKPKRNADEEAEFKLLPKKIAQKKAQISDEEIVGKAKVYGYESRKIEFDGGEYDRPAIEELIRWRLWDRTGGGLMAELGSHQLDAASIFIAAVHGGKKQYPLNVSAAAGRPLFPVDRDVDDHVYCLFEYPAPGYDPDDPEGAKKKITVAYASINGNGFGGYGETVFGTKGTMLLETEKDGLLFLGSKVDDKTRVVENKDKETKDHQPCTLVADAKGDPISAAVGTQGLGTDISRGYTEELEHWAWCILHPESKNLPHCRPEVALADAVIALTTNQAARDGSRIEFDPDWFKVESNKTPENIEPDLSRYA